MVVCCRRGATERCLGARTALTLLPNEEIGSNDTPASIDLRRFRNLFSSSEVVLERYFNRSTVNLHDVLDPLNRSLKILRQVQDDVARQELLLNNNHSAVFELLELRKVLEKVLVPLTEYRASLFTFSDALHSSSDG